MKNQLVLFLLIAVMGNVIGQSQGVLFIGGTAHLGNDSIINNAVVGIKNGQITLVTNTSGQYNKSDYAEVVDFSGKHLYPGIIAPNSTLGLTEIEAVRATNDFRDVGTMLPNVRTLIAYNTDSKVIPTVRNNGILLVQVTPRGGLVSGTSSIFKLDGWNWEDAVYKTDDGIHINWPKIQTRKFLDEDNTEMGPFEKNKEYLKQAEELNSLFEKALSYSKTLYPEEKNLRYRAMAGLFNGSQTAYIHADYVKEISEAIAFVKKYAIKRVAIVGGKDSWMVADQLRENNIAVMVARVHDLPQRVEDDVDLPYKLPYLLQEAGVLFCLNNEGDMEAMGTRNLPFMAGTAAAYGLTKEQALKAVTLNTAKILGIDKTTGSIETGKDATLFISTGDALDMRTSNVERAYIKGKSINLDNEQKELYLKYKNKYQLK